MIQKILKKKYLKRHSFLTFVFFLFSLNAFSATWYVNTTGSDANAGTTAGAPFLTIQKAINAASSGDVVTIATGTYNNFVLVTKNITFDINNANVTIKSLVLKTSSVKATITSATTAGNLLITDSFELTDGLVVISGATPPQLKTKSGAKLVGGNKNSYVDGGYWIGSTNNSAITWAVGSGADYRPINITSFTKSGSSEEFYFARVLANGPSFTQSLPASTRNISKVHHYYMNTTATNLIAYNFILKFSYDSITNDDHVYDFTNLQLLTSTGTGPWLLNNSVGTANRMGTIASGSITNLAGFYILGNKIGSQTSGLLGGLNTLGSADVFAGFTVVIACEGDTVRFYSNSKSIGSSITNYVWDFGDGSPTQTGTNAWHVYSYSTPTPLLYTYTVSLRVENGSSIDIGYNTVFIPNTPRVPLAQIFTQSVELLPKVVRSVCQGQTTRITDPYIPISGEVMQKKVWTITPVVPTFVKGNTAGTIGYKDSTRINYKFNSGGTFKIFITRTNQYGCKATDSQDYISHSKPAIFIDAVDQCWDANKSIAITNGTADPSPDKMLKWSWDLGDGTKLNGQTGPPVLLKTVFHKYATAGSRLIKLSVTTDADCKDSMTKIVNLFAKPLAQFTATKTCIGEVTNTLNSSGVASPENILYDIWNWGDGSPNDSAMPNSAHTYAKIGLYKILLEVQSDNICKDTQTFWIRVHPKPVPLYSVKEACFGDTNRFRRLLNFKYPRQDSMYWNWTFDDTIMATDTTARIKFKDPGVHKVRLVGTSKAGCQDSSLGIFQVYYRPKPTFSLDASVIPNDSMQCQKWNKFTFVQNYGVDPNDTILTSKWVWGDTFKESPAVTLFHSYDTTGLYKPRLVVTNIHGCADSITQTINVVASPIPNFAYKGVCMPDSVYFYDTLTYSLDTIKQRYWDFGNGVTDTNILNRNVYFKNAGPYNASYIVKTKNGCSDTAFVNINTLVDRPVISWNMSGSISPLCKGDSTIYTVIGGDSIIWQTDNDSVFVKAISKTGNYVFKTYNKGVCYSMDSVQVYAYPPANIKAHSDTTIFRGRKASVYVSNALKNFNWYPGKYVADSTKVGTSTIQLTDSITLFVVATDSNGCTDVDSIHIRVVDPPLVKIPNIITPNGDKSNEYWDLIEIPDVFLFDIVISDRQGKRVFFSNNYLNNWNGVDSDGNVLPNGVYFYYMKNRQTNDEYRGYIQIIR
jgi:gliding motility-associated-like protein